MMASTTVKVSRKYQVVIPESIRRQAGIKPGDEMMVLNRHGVLQYIRVRPIRETLGLDAPLDTKDLRDEHDRM
jgi:AbrB family looped-hinge helix DNA binding protein